MLAALAVALTRRPAARAPVVAAAAALAGLIVALRARRSRPGCRFCIRARAGRRPRPRHQGDRGCGGAASRPGACSGPDPGRPDGARSPASRASSPALVAWFERPRRGHERQRTGTHERDATPSVVAVRPRYRSGRGTDRARLRRRRRSTPSRGSGWTASAPTGRRVTRRSRACTPCSCGRRGSRSRRRRRDAAASPRRRARRHRHRGGRRRPDERARAPRRLPRRAAGSRPGSTSSRCSRPPSSSASARGRAVRCRSSPRRGALFSSEALEPDGEARAAELLRRSGRRSTRS